MPAVFQIVSRSSGKALARTTPAPQQPDFAFTSNIVQSTQNDQDSTQMWVLTPQDAAADFLIQPLGSPDLAIEVFASVAHETDFPGSRAYYWTRPSRTGMADQPSHCESTLLLPTGSQQRPADGRSGPGNRPDLHPHRAQQPTMDVPAPLCAVTQGRVVTFTPRRVLAIATCAARPGAL